MKIINMILCLIILVFGILLVVTIKKDLKEQNSNKMNIPLEERTSVTLTSEKALTIANIYQEEGYELVIEEQIVDDKYIINKQKIETKKAQMTLTVDIYTGEIIVTNLDYPLVIVNSH